MAIFSMGKVACSVKWSVSDAATFNFERNINIKWFKMSPPLSSVGSFLPTSSSVHWFPCCLASTYNSNVEEEEKEKEENIRNRVAKLWLVLTVSKPFSFTIQF